MNKKYYKYIFTFLVLLSSSFLCLSSVKAEKVELEITSFNNKSKLYYNYNSLAFKARYKLYFSTESKYGGNEEWAKTQCNTICSSECEFEKKSYTCFVDNLANGVYYEKTSDYGYPQKLVYDSSTVGTSEGKIVVNNCFTSYYRNQTEENTETLTFGCSSYEECSKACLDTCREFNVNYVNQNGFTKTGATAWFCKNNNLAKSVFINVDGEEITWNSTKAQKTKDEVIDDYGEKKKDFFDNWSNIAATINGISEIANGEISCDGETGVLGKAWNVLQTIFTLIKIVGIALLIVLSMLDFMKAVTADDAAVMKRATKNAIIRIVIVVALFMLPALVNLILKITYISSGTCGIK